MGAWGSFADSPAVLHVGRFVHTHGQFDLQLGILAVLGHQHAVEVGLLGPVGGGVQDHLKRGTPAPAPRNPQAR